MPLTLFWCDYYHALFSIWMRKNQCCTLRDHTISRLIWNCGKGILILVFQLVMPVIQFLVVSVEFTKNILNIGYYKKCNYTHEPRSSRSSVQPKQPKEVTLIIEKKIIISWTKNEELGALRCLEVKECHLMTFSRQFERVFVYKYKCVLYVYLHMLAFCYRCYLFFAFFCIGRAEKPLFGI